MRRKQFFRWDGFSQKFLLVAGVSLSAGVLWLTSCDAPAGENSVTNATDNSTGNASSLAAPPSPTAQPTPHRGVSYTLFIPNNDGMLSREVIRDTSPLVPLTYEQKSQRALELLWKKLKFLPEGTQLLEAPKKEKSGVVRLNFTKAFLQLDTAPDNVVLLILDSISQSLGALESKNVRPNKPARIMIVVDGKRVAAFNQFSLAEPWEASIIEETTPGKSADDQSIDSKSSDRKTSDNKSSDNQVGGGV